MPAFTPVKLFALPVFRPVVTDQSGVASVLEIDRGYGRSPPRRLCSRAPNKAPRAPSNTTQQSNDQWTPSERQDVGTGSRPHAGASLAALEMGEGGAEWTWGRLRNFVRG